MSEKRVTDRRTDEVLAMEMRKEEGKKGKGETDDSINDAERSSVFFTLRQMFTKLIRLKLTIFFPPRHIQSFKRTKQHESTTRYQPFMEFETCLQFF